jgi:hypothetical protein
VGSGFGATSHRNTKTRLEGGIGSMWLDKDEAYVNIVESIKVAVETFIASK